MNVSAINKATGEQIDLPANTPDEIVEAWRVCQEYVKAADALKDQLKKLVPNLVGDRGTSEPIGNYQFRVSNIQRKTYDKAVMRQVLDDDVFDLLLKPDKPAVDRYLKDNLEDLGDASTRLRQSMIDDGVPYQQIRLEKLERSE